jgi:hypothetical protein
MQRLQLLFEMAELLPQSRMMFLLLETNCCLLHRLTPNQ